MLALMAPATAFAQSQRLNRDGKLDLKVLYVGGQPDFEEMGRTRRSAEEVEASVKSRMTSFESFLKSRFTDVKAIRGSEYKPELSNDYDVTIFDGRLPEIEPARMGYDSNGEGFSTRARVLPYDFDQAAITIASMGELVTRAIGSKNDWYCLCLDAHAHHWVAEHPIFKGPFPVSLKTEMRPTPEDAKHYTYYYDEPLPDSTLMWRVQYNGYSEKPDALIGMVARPWGYVEANDSEYISSGVCAKTIDAVALGRHGNFFHWGFAGSPADMTEEGRQVFANAVAYMAQFNGTTMLVRKDNDRISTREYIREEKYLATMEPYEERVGWTVEANKMGEQMQKAARAKKEKGEELTMEEQYYLDFQPQTPMTLDEYLQRYETEAYAVLGTDLEKYPAYYDENTPYFYGGEGMYTLSIDEDCKAWGIDNHDVKLLDKAITCLEKGVEVDRAKRILDRYTLCTFATAREWRDWYRKYHKKMFFTESGGWVFMIDGPSTLPGNDFYARKRARQAVADAAEAALTAEQANLATPTYQNPVCVAAKWVPGESGQGRIEISFAIYKGFHVYRTVAEEDPYIAVSVETAAPEYGFHVGEMIAPPARPYETPGTTVYDNDFKIVIPVSTEMNMTGPVTCTVGWQACDDRMCTAPMTKEFKVMVNK